MRPGDAPQGSGTMPPENSSFPAEFGNQQAGQKRTHAMSEGAYDHYTVSMRSGFLPEPHPIALDEAAFQR